MKNLIILSIILLFSCQKQDSKPTQTLTEVTDYLVPAQGKPKKIRNIPPPTPPPPVPPTTSSVNRLLVVFNGMQVNSSHWGVFYAPPANMTATQQTEALNFASNMYAAYKIDLTTNEHTYNATDPTRRGIVIVTDSSMRGGSSGSALLNSFGTSDNIAFVYSAVLGNDAKYVGDIIAHEAGHQFNLYHQTDCTNNIVTNEYRNGVIMGSPFSAYPATWVTGTSYACTIQNDHQLLVNKLGLR